MPQVLITVACGKGMLDDDYTLFKDGTIKREYDRNTFSLNHWIFYAFNEAPDHIKKIIYTETINRGYSKEFQEKVYNLLYS